MEMELTLEMVNDAVVEVARRPALGWAAFSATNLRGGRWYALPIHPSRVKADKRGRAMIDVREAGARRPYWLRLKTRTI
jgi:hypothetical protein